MGTVAHRPRGSADLGCRAHPLCGHAMGHQPMNLISLLTAIFVVVLASPAAALAAAPSFGTPTVVAELGQPLTFSSTIDGDDISTVDVLVHLAGNATTIVINAGTQINDIYQAQANIDIASSALCACLANGTTAPNT